MAYSPVDFQNGEVLNDSDLDQLQSNVTEVRRSHLGPAAPTTVEAGVPWIDTSSAIWEEKIHDGTSFLSVNRIDPVSNMVMSVDTRRRNVVLNGCLNVWQDSTSEAGVTVANNRIADGWRFGASNQGTWTIDRDTNVPPATLSGRHLNYAIRATCTAADTTVGAGDYALLIYSVEGYDYEELYQQPQHLSFLARAKVPATYHVAIRNGANDRSLVLSYPISIADTWELKEFQIQTSPSGGTWDFTSGLGLSVVFTLASGTTFHTTSGAWQNGNFLATSAQANAAAAVNNYLEIAGVRLHGGTVRSHVIVPTFDEVMLWAGRRFHKTFPYGTKPAQASGTFSGALRVHSSDTGLGCAMWNFTNRMRGTPTVATYNPTQANANWRNNNDTSDATALVQGVADSGLSIVVSPAGGAGNYLAIHATADARF